MWRSVLAVMIGVPPSCDSVSHVICGGAADEHEGDEDGGETGQPAHRLMQPLVACLACNHWLHMLG
jgi:hypothetical protein